MGKEQGRQRLHASRRSACAFTLVFTGVLVPCAQALTVSDPFAVSATVAGSCSLITGGGVTSYDTATPVDTTLDAPLAFVTCDNGVAWELSVDEGLHADAGSSCAAPLRRLNLNSSYLDYQLYMDPGYVSVHGCDSPNNTMTGMGSGGTDSITGYLLFPQGQAPTDIGVYSDTLVVTLTF